MNVYFIQAYRRFNFSDYLRNHGEDIKKYHNLIVLDISKIIGQKKRNFCRISNYDLEKIKDIKIINFNSFFKLIQFLIKTPKKSFFICEGLSVELISLFLYLLIKIKKSYIIRQSFEVVLTRNYKEKPKNIYKFVKKVLKIFIDVYIKFMKKYFMIKPDFYIYTGRSNRDFYNDFLGQKTKKISTYATEIREIKKKKYININFKYAIFLDQAFGYHPETLNQSLTKKNYDLFYERLEKFFLFLEEKYQLKIVIAAHPLIKENGFENREVFQNKTSELIMNAEFIISASSSSLMYPVLLNKGIILIYSEIINNLHSISINMKVFKKLFNFSNVSIDDNFFDNTTINYLNFSKRKKLINKLAFDPTDFQVFPYNYIEKEYLKKN